MKYLLTVLLFYMQSQTSLSQSYYSKIFNLNSSIFGSEFSDFIVQDNNLIIYTGIYCENGNTYYPCGKILRLDFGANLLMERFLDSLSISDNFNAFSRSNKNFYVSSNPVFVGENSIWLYKLNTVFKTENFRIDSIYSKDKFINRGIYFINDNLFTCDVIYSNLNPNLPTLELSKRDTCTLQKLWTRSYYLGNFAINAHDLQLTSDSYLSFIMSSHPGAGVSSIEPMIKILKIDWEGNVVDSFQFEDDGKNYISLLASSSGNYYFSSQRHPAKPKFTVGSINKLNKDLELEWSLELPNNQLKDGRIYRIARITECKNGDILVTGRVWDNSDGKILGADISSVYNGFLGRIKSDGIVDWIRIFKLPQELIDKEIYGQFRPSILEKAIELSNGDIVACGEVYYNNHQISAIDILKVQTNQLWIIKVNSSGCLPEYICDTIIRIRPTTQVKTQEFNIGTEWIFETDYSIGGGHSSVQYITKKILDTNNTNGKKIYYLSSGDSMYVENDRMFFWNNMLNSYEMHYQFNSTSDYDIKYWDFSRNSVQIAKVKVDSIYNTVLNRDTITTQLLRVSNNGSFASDLIIPVYKNIGASKYDVKLYLGFGLFDPNPIVTKLRCFKSDSIEYNFQSYPCDSTWFITNTGNFEAKEIEIQPNPTSGKIKVHGISPNATYILFNIQGQIISAGNCPDGEIYIPLIGVFILKIQIDDGYFFRKIIRL